MNVGCYWVLLGVAFLALSSSSQAILPKKGEIDPKCAKVLSADIVTKVAGTKVELFPYDPMKGAGGHCNYAVGGQMAVLMNLDSGDAAYFKKFKENPKSPYIGNQKTLTGIGDAAFSSGNIVLAHKGRNIVILSPFRNKSTGKPFFDSSQLGQLANSALATN